MKYADCHPDRPNDSHGLCNACRLKKGYDERRAQGLPSWRARRETLGQWTKKYAQTKLWRQRNPEKAAAQFRRHYEKRKRLYGSGRLWTMASRVKWLEAKANRARAGAPLSNASGKDD